MEKKERPVSETRNIRAMVLIERGKTGDAISVLQNVTHSEKAIQALKNDDSVLAKKILSEGAKREFRITDLVIESMMDMYRTSGFVSGSNSVRDVYNSSLFVPGTRALDLTSGAGLVPEVTRYDLMTKPRLSLFTRAGVTLNIVEDGKAQGIPKITEPAFVTDIYNSALVDSPTDLEIGTLAKTEMKEIAAVQPMSRLMVLQLGETGNEILKEEQNFRIEQALDNRILYGTGSNGQANGIFYNTDVDIIDGSSFSEDKCSIMIDMVKSQEPGEDGLTFVCNSATEKLLRKRAITGLNRRMIEDGKLYGENYIVSERIQDGHLWYGKFSSVVLTLFYREIILNPSTATPGVSELITKVGYDTTLREPKWIVVAEDVD